MPGIILYTSLCVHVFVSLWWRSIVT